MFPYHPFSEFLHVRYPGYQWWDYFGVCKLNICAIGEEQYIFKAQRMIFGSLCCLEIP